MLSSIQEYDSESDFPARGRILTVVVRGLIEQRKEVEPSMRILLDIENPETATNAELQTTFEEMIDGAGFCFYPDSGAC